MSGRSPPWRASSHKENVGPKPRIQGSTQPGWGRLEHPTWDWSRIQREQVGPWGTGSTWRKEIKISLDRARAINKRVFYHRHFQGSGTANGSEIPWKDVNLPHWEHDANRSCFPRLSSKNLRKVRWWSNGEGMSSSVVSKRLEVDVAAADPVRNDLGRNFTVGPSSRYMRKAR